MGGMGGMGGGLPGMGDFGNMMGGGMPGMGDGMGGMDFEKVKFSLLALAYVGIEPCPDDGGYAEE